MLGGCVFIPAASDNTPEEIITDSDKMQITDINITTNEISFSYHAKTNRALAFELKQDDISLAEKQSEETDGVITFTDLTMDTTYFLTISEIVNKALNLKGNPLYQNYFTTDYIDLTPPTVNPPSEIHMAVGDNYNEKLIAALRATDNHDKALELTYTFDLPDELSLGYHNVSYRVADKKGNFITGIVVIFLTADPNGPEITTEGTVFTYYSNLEVPDLKSFFTVTDAKDGEIKVNDAMLNMQNSDLTLGLNYVTLTAIDSDFNETKMTIIIDIKESNAPRPTAIKEDITKLDANNLPSVGNPRVLVIPVAIGSYAATEEMRATIEKGFFGSNSETGWESLQSYYYKSSYGKLKISGTVTDWYYAKHNEAYYANYTDSNNYIYGSTLLLDEALKALKDKYNFNDYDTNNDGFIDSVYLIYNVPIGGNGSEKEEDFYWAYTTWDQQNRDYGYNASSYAYMFASYEFFNEDLQYAGSNQPTINAETFIHETGHLLGINDFYDTTADDKYDNAGGFGGADMMDYNIGDHHPYTKMLLGWAKPIVITQSGTYEINASVLTGDFLLISKNTFTTPFSEYFIIDLYSFLGLNERELPGFYQTTNNYAGVRVTKINATTYYSRGYYYLKYNNADTKYKEIELMEADYNGSSFDIREVRYDFSSGFSYESTSKLSDYYLADGQTFGNKKWDNYKLADGSKINFTMKVVKIDAYKATINITFK